MNKRPNACIPIVVAALLCLAPSGWTATSVYEGFDYGSGALAPNNGGSGWAGAWTNTSGVVSLSTDSNSLAFPTSLALTGEGRRVDDTGGGQTERSFSGGFAFNASNAFYMSFLLRKSNGGASGDNLNLYIRETNTSTIALGVGIGSGESYQLQLGNAVTSTVNSAYAAGSTVFAVVKLVTGAGTTNDRAWLKIYNASDTVDLIEPSSWTLSYSTNITSSVLYDRFRIAAGANTEAELDEIRMGNAWNLVVIPEPSTISMGLVAATLFLGLRRRISRRPAH